MDKMFVLGRDENITIDKSYFYVFDKEEEVEGLRNGTVTIAQLIEKYEKELKEQDNGIDG